MLRSIIALTAMAIAVSLPPTLRAADSVLTLACQGEAIYIEPKTGSRREEPRYSMGIIVNFTARTVQGFETRGVVYPIKITKMNDVVINFDGGSPTHSNVQGGINRVT